MNKLRDLYYRYASLIGILIGLFIIIVSTILVNRHVDEISYFDYRKNKQMPFYTSGGVWLGSFIILLSIKKKWLFELIKETKLFFRRIFH